MANATILGAPRLSLGATVVGNNPVGMPATNLNNDEPSQKCRMDSADPADTYIYVPQLSYPLGYYGATFGVGGIGVINHNLSIGATARTLLLDADAVDPTPTRLAPTAATQVVGSWSGAFSDIDESPYSADAGKMTCLGTSSQVPSLRLHMANPASNPKTGTDLQMFRVMLSWTGDDPSSITFELYDNNVLIEEIEYGVDGGQPLPSSGDIVLLPWDAADLADPGGGAVQFQISAVLADSADDFSVEAADWLCDLGPTGGSILYDSGWELATYDTTDTQWGSTVAGVAGVAPTQNYVHYPPTEIAGVAQAITLFRDPFNSAGYVDVGCYVLGPIFRPTINRAWGPLVGVRDLSIKKFSHGGQTFGVKRPRLRTISLPLHELSAAEAHSLLDRVNWRKGTLSPVLVSLFPGDATEGRHTTIWATVEQMDEMAANFFGDYRAMNLTFVEKQ